MLETEIHGSQPLIKIFTASHRILIKIWTASHRIFFTKTFEAWGLKFCNDTKSTIYNKSNRSDVWNRFLFLSNEHVKFLFDWSPNQYYKMVRKTKPFILRTVDSWWTKLAVSHNVGPKKTYDQFRIFI